MNNLPVIVGTSVMYMGACVLLGLNGREYDDAADGGRYKTQGGELRISGEVDRVFADAPSRLRRRASMPPAARSFLSPTPAPTPPLPASAGPTAFPAP